MNTSTSPLRKSLQVTYSVPRWPSTPTCGKPIALDTPGMPPAPPKYGGPTSKIGRDGSNVLPPSREIASVTFKPSFQTTYCVPSGATVPMMPTTAPLSSRGQPARVLIRIGFDHVLPASVERLNNTIDCSRCHSIQAL